MSDQQKETVKPENQNQELSPEELDEVAGGMLSLPRLNLTVKAPTVTAPQLPGQDDLAL